MRELTALELKKFIEALDIQGKAYDLEEKMLVTYIDKPAVYCSKISGRAHPTRESLGYAVALLDSGIEQNRTRAVDIIKKVVSLQDTDCGSRTYGIWSWYLEEPLYKMSPPDYNWADFCGIHLLQVVLDHSEFIKPDLAELVKQSIFHICNFIKSRKINPSYTNIAIMDIYVTLVAGDIYNWKDIFIHGKEYFKIFYNYTKASSTFTEYNSPTYTLIALAEITRILNHVNDKECLAMADELHRIAWRCIAIHYHPASGQWAGPHSRCYKTLQSSTLWSILQLATNGKVKIVTYEELEIDYNYIRLQFHCPEEYISYFTGQDKSRVEKEVFKEAYYLDGNDPAQEATTYQALTYSLGSFRTSDLWSQRSALIAYWGKFAHPAYMRLRCLKNGYDYSSAVVNSVQMENNVLSLINFAVDGGDTHPYLDKIINATIKVKDFRLRLEFGGAIDNIILPEVWKKGETVKVISGNTAIMANVPYSEFSGYDIWFESGRNKEIAYLDIIFYTGNEKNICFKELNQAICGLAIRICELTDKNQNFAKPEICYENDILQLKWKTNGEELQVRSFAKPAKMLELYTYR